MTDPVAANPGGVRFAVRVVPRGGRDAVDGWGTDSAGRAYLKLRLRAVPEDGKANAALIALLARYLDVPRSHVEIATGARARIKTLAVRGNPEELRRRLVPAAAEIDAKSGAKF